VFECVEDVVLEQLLVRHTHFDGHAGWAVLSVPVTHTDNTTLELSKIKPPSILI
jgi:hypothetical protein